MLVAITTALQPEGKAIGRRLALETRLVLSSHVPLF